MPTAADSTLPRRAGGFELQRELGRGGMGVVYEAQELASGRRVALKVLLADLALSQEAFERFRREARIAASLSDARCVFVYGAHVVEGSPAIAMELVGGETLEQRIARGRPIPVEQAVRWTIEILEGLEAAAASGIVHRDVKPSNCFLTEDGHVKVGDFGLARTVQADLRITLTGQFLGSPLYASPEQVRGRAIDQRSDLYSCGATLYALLTGAPPHSGTNLGEVLANILSETPASPRELRPDVPRGLARVVLKALERDPRRRFQTHAEMRSALLAYVADSSSPGHPLPRAAACVIDFVACWALAQAATQSLGLLGSPELVRRPPDHVWRLANPLLDAAFVLLPLAYFAAFEALASATPGKWLLGLRVVAPRADAAGRARVALRALVFLAPVLLRDLVARLTEPAGVTYVLVLVPASALVTLGLSWSARLGNGWRGLHELASGTRTIQRRPPFSSIARAAPPPDAPLAAYPGMPARVGAYVVQGAVGRTPWGILLQARDEALERSVWVLELDPGREQVPEERRMVDRPGRVRWLDALEANGRRYEVFEDPGGTSLLACTARGLLMTSVTLRRLLSSLADELVAAGSEPISLHQLWIDRSWNLRVLDASAGETPGAALAPCELFAQAARALLPRGAELPRDCPESAEPVARRLFGLAEPYTTLQEARNALASLDARPAHVTRRARTVQLGFALGPIGLLVALLMVATIGLSFSMGAALEAGLQARSIVRGTTPVLAGARVEDPGVELRPLTEDERRARELLIADWKRGGLSPSLQLELSPEEKAQIDHAVELHPDPTQEELAWARSARGPLERSAKDPIDDVQRVAFRAPVIAALVWWVLALPGLLLGGGLSFGLAELRLRDRRGMRASRALLALRTTLAAASVALLYAPAWVVYDHAGATAAWVALALAAGAHAALVVHALVDPARGLLDRILGTRIVPR